MTFQHQVTHCSLSVSISYGFHLILCYYFCYVTVLLYEFVTVFPFYIIAGVSGFLL